MPLAETFVSENLNTMLNQKRWYAVYTRPRWEKKVSYLLTRQKIENYCPVNKVQRKWSDRKKIVLEPLFTSYVFVNIDEAQQLSIRATDGVINFVHWLSKPAVIRDEEIETIRQFLNDFSNVQLEKIPVKTNDLVKIVRGALMEHRGQVVATKNKTIKIRLPSLGFMMYAEIEASMVEIISSPGMPSYNNQQ
jgi:transcription antitermination factor NusG